MVRYKFVRHWVSYFVSVIFLSLLITILLWYFTPQPQQSTNFRVPIPTFLSLHENNEVRGLTLWFPFLQKTEASEKTSNMYTAQAVLMYDLTTNKVLFEKNAEQRLPMASLTKIMTAIIAFENRKADDRYIVTGDALVGEDSMGLSTGETLSLEDLMYGLVLNSGNDAAEVIAHNYPDGRNAFVVAMNKRAASLGLTNTHFTNPTGLQGDGDQYTTPHDLLIITKYALENFPLFAKVAATTTYTIPQTATHKEYDIANETNLLTTYPGVKGVKTGYTPEAGLCLVTYLEYGNHQIIGILLNSQNRREEMKELLDYSLTSLGIKPPPYSG